jgi:hypothetical protein
MAQGRRNSRRATIRSPGASRNDRGPFRLRVERSDEAIQTAHAAMDCVALLAMTVEAMVDFER